MKKIITLSVITTVYVMSSGYKLPEQSLNSLALASAYVAHTTHADAAYYNPAAMAFMTNKNHIDGSLTLAHIDSQEYNLGVPFSGQTKIENIAIPSFHYVSPAMGDFRVGLSFVVPGGLTRRWETPYQKLSAEEFTLKVMELNPVVSYMVSDYISIGAGARFVYSEGIVKSDGSTVFNIKREMEGNGFAVGYNAAMLLKMPFSTNFAVTYRSEVDLKEEGEANLYFGGVGKQFADSSVTVPLPATLAVALSKTWQEKFTLEFTYERTFWSAYKNLDFKYAQPVLNPVLKNAFATPKLRDWKDTNTFRFGATVVMDNKVTAMFGFGIDETPVPKRTVGFELADSDSKFFSMGFRYQQTANLSWGTAFLYSDKESLSLEKGKHEDTSSTNILNQGGSFEEGNPFLMTVGLSYEF